MIISLILVFAIVGYMTFALATMICIEFEQFTFVAFFMAGVITMMIVCLVALGILNNEYRNSEEFEAENE